MVGRKWYCAMYPCKSCGFKIQLRDFPTAVCRVNGQPPPVSERKRIWQDIRKRAVQRTKPPPKAKRLKVAHPDHGVRVGEASNPGPKCFGPSHHPLNIWSVNLSSWRRHGNAILDLATESNVHILLLQETNVSQISGPSFSHQIHRQGWQSLHVPPAGVQQKRWRCHSYEGTFLVTSVAS